MKMARSVTDSSLPKSMERQTTNLLKSGRACVGHGGEGDSDGVHEGDSVHHHACGPECGEGHVDEE